jgi:hypothetical protein
MFFVKKGAVGLKWSFYRELRLMRSDSSQLSCTSIHELLRAIWQKPFLSARTFSGPKLYESDARSAPALRNG